MNSSIGLLGTIIELVGTSIAVLDQFSFINKILLQTCPIKQVNVGLNRLTHKTLDEKLRRARASPKDI